MSFYSSIIDFLRGIRSSVSTHYYQGYTKTYSFGTIVSGTYNNWKTDQHPTILCLGSYQAANGKNYTHGIQLHAVDPFDRQWLMKTIYDEARRADSESEILLPVYEDEQAGTD